MIDKDDIQKLEIILDALIKSNSEINHNKFSEHEYFTEKNSEDRKREFQRFIDYFEEYNCATIIKHGYFNSLIINHKTVKFKEAGGFAKIYQDELALIEKKEEIDSLSIKKLKWDAKLSKWQVKTFWPVFVFGLLGFIFGLYNAITQIIDSKKTKELQLEMKNIQEEVSKLRTLVLDKKTVDSLRNSKNQVDTLNKK